jgi:hypothetical protein
MVVVRAYIGALELHLAAGITYLAAGTERQGPSCETLRWLGFLAFQNAFFWHSLTPGPGCEVLPCLTFLLFQCTPDLEHDETGLEL